MTIEKKQQRVWATRTHKEVAELIGLAEITVRRIEKKAFDKIRQMQKDKGISREQV